MTRPIDDPAALVTASIDGDLRASNLARLDGYPHVKVVLRSDADPAKVALVSGGGSGHEPAHAGFVGRGMLTAAVCGEVFASPSVEAVLAGILAVTGQAGCLLIVKNYTGDRLNFGLAAERARALGLRVETVFVADDIALPELPQPRGVAGTLFVHKIAGHAAESGASLDEVADIARSVSAAARSYGVAFDNVTVPGQAKDDRIPAGHVELGLGIHGEPGVETVPFESTAALGRTIMEALYANAPEEQRVLLVNDLGASTPLELGALLGTLLDGPHGDRVTAAIGPARLMTSLDMQGFSLSTLPAKQAWVEALAAPVEPVAWPPLRPVHEVRVRAMPVGLERDAASPSHDAERRALVLAACDAFEAMEADLNALDAKAGDGDTGATVAGAARDLRAAVDSLPLADDAALFRALSERLSSAMGGSSGVLLAIFFAAAADAADGGTGGPAALVAGLERMMEIGGAEPGHRTMIDALKPALEALVGGGDAAAAARQGADATASMGRAKSGRSAYLSESSLSGTVDPGAEGVARLFEALAARG